MASWINDPVIHEYECATPSKPIHPPCDVSSMLEKRGGCTLYKDRCFQTDLLISGNRSPTLRADKPAVLRTISSQHERLLDENSTAQVAMGALHFDTLSPMRAQPLVFAREPLRPTQDIASPCSCQSAKKSRNQFDMAWKELDRRRSPFVEPLLPIGFNCGRIRSCRNMLETSTAD